MIKVKRLSEAGCIPTKVRFSDAGWDLYASESVSIVPNQRKLIKTDIAVEIPKGYYGHICPRSGLALKSGITVMGGVIDSEYRGEVKVLLHSLNDEIVFFNKGDRIAQLVIQPILICQMEEVSELSESDRGEKGFGSSDQPYRIETISCAILDNREILKGEF